ncbi:hypothetical protein NEIMUCOT_06390 [Neisseria mucosa ATCC 25996]|uniref:Uncharacterized protein n=1 Tax=Neisseria mucosa (strain ATCC 25996 / DSM 4631 / NCTC 10774 / M26) TaxID=546266 RepID=D3A0F4_NEIM2|nr:hypothetical protein NEIMUCOT_06390 [Neisseria mucosa ATCC 25996]
MVSDDPKGRLKLLSKKSVDTIWMDGEKDRHALFRLQSIFTNNPFPIFRRPLRLKQTKHNLLFHTFRP